MSELKTTHSTTYKLSTDYSKESWTTTNSIELPLDIDARIEFAEKSLQSTETVLNTLILGLNSGAVSFQDITDQMALIKNIRVKSTKFMKDYLDENGKDSYQGLIKYSMKNKIIKEEIEDFEKVIMEMNLKI